MMAILHIIYTTKTTPDNVEAGLSMANKDDVLLFLDTGLVWLRKDNSLFHQRLSQYPCYAFCLAPNNQQAYASFTHWIDIEQMVALTAKHNSIVWH